MRSEAGTRSLAEVLGDLPRGRSVTLAETLEAAGPRAHGSALLLLVLPEALPLPVPSLSAVLGLPLLLITLHLAAYGGEARLPRRLGDLALPGAVVGALRDRVAPLLARAEHVSRPRWQGIAAPERVLALVCLYLAAVLLLPLPFFNTPPALCLALIAWGMLRRDGLAVALGLAGTLGVTAALGWLAESLAAWAAVLV